MKKGIAVAGSIIHDRIFTIDAYPELGTLTRIIKIKNAVGGLVPNDGIDIKKLDTGVPVYALGRIGDDDSGKLCLDAMRDVEIDTSLVKVSPGSVTGFTDVMSIEGGQRTFFTHSGANDEFSFEDIPWDSLSVDMLHLGYFLLLKKIDSGDGMRILIEAKKRGIKTSVDFVSELPEKYPPLTPCLEFVDNLILNEHEAGALVGMTANDSNLEEIAEKLLSFGVRERVIIHSPMLSVSVTASGEKTSLGSLKLPDGYIVGTAGAGDAFCSGALLGIYHGVSEREILEWATYSAAQSLSSADGTSAMDSLQNIKLELSGLSFREC